jgi:hypothetical protein
MAPNPRLSKYNIIAFLTIVDVARAKEFYRDKLGLQNPRHWSYGVDAADQTHNMTFNFIYNMPAASKLAPNPAVRLAFDNWVLSGISQFATGQPVAMSFTTTDGTNLNGGGDAQRMDIVGNANTGGHSPSGSTRQPSAAPE